MIFKNLFRPKYQDPNPQVRISAIQNLSPTDSAHKSQLHELAFNDEDPGVSIAALDKLNSFALWSKMAETSKLERIKKKAQSMVENALFDVGSLNISQEEKRTFISECKNNSLLEKVLKQDWIKNDDTELAQIILKKLDKPQLTKQFFFQTNNTELQLQLLCQFEEETILNKIVKRNIAESLTSEAKRKLGQLHLQKTKPIELEQKSKLILSQLLALKDKTDVSEITTAMHRLEQEFLDIKGEFHFFKETKRTELEEKYIHIQARLTALIEQLTPAWEQDNREREQRVQFDDLLKKARNLLELVATSLDKDASKITLGQVEEFEGKLQDLKEKLAQFGSKTSSSDTELVQKIETLFNELSACNTTLQRLPEFQHAIEQAKLFLTSFSALTLPSDRSQIEASEAHLKEQKQNWLGLTQVYASNWPKDLNAQWSHKYQLWRKAIRELKGQVEQDTARCRNKLKVIENLNTQGKYKAAMGLYERVQNWFQELPERQQSSLSRQFTKVKEQIENLKDWQEYVAQPRKPAVLAEVEKIVEDPLPVEQQSAAVKHLRSQWNSFGKLDNEADVALNQAFDLAIEKAFEPCRQHYAQQQTIREENLAKKNALLTELESLQQAELEDGEFARTFRDLQTRWKDAGDVDYRELDALNRRYRDVISPLKVKLDALFTHYSDQKQALIKRAEKLLLEEDVYAAVDAAKKLQNEWKNIPHAGKKKDNILWAEFRKFNDQVFAKRAAIQQEDRQQTDEIQNQLNNLLSALENVINEADTKATLSQADEFRPQVMELIQSLPSKIIDKYQKKLRKLIDLQESKLLKIEGHQVKREYSILFESLKSWEQQDIPEAVKGLSNQWQQCFSRVEGKEKHDRREITIKMEIMAGVDSPDDDLALRKDIQLKIMADKLEKGENLDKTTLLKNWISQGPLDQAEQTLLARIEALY